MTTKPQPFQETRRQPGLNGDWETIGRLVRSETMRALASHFAAMAKNRADAETDTTERDRT